jgi:hypothetical protein
MVHSFELPPQLTKNDKNARKCGRVRCQLTHCDLGEILDLSVTGMRVACRKKPAADVGATLSVIIDGHEDKFDVTGKLVWKKKVGWFKWIIGVEFEELMPGAKKGLTLLARASINNDTIAVRERGRPAA